MKQGMRAHRIFFYTFFGLMTSLLNIAISLASKVPDIIIGSPSAPVKIIEYSSMTCHFCADFHGKIFPLLEQKYINTGKVQLIFRHFSSDEMGLAAAALIVKANDLQKKALLHKFFAHQAQWMTPKYVNELAHLAGMSAQAASTIIEDKGVREALAADFLAAEKQFKIEATPYFIINGQVIPYKPSFEKLEALLNPTTSPQTAQMQKVSAAAR